MRFDNFYSKIVEKDEHKRSKEYKKLTPKMKKAVDEIFNKMDSNSSDFINSFENNINFCLLYTSPSPRDVEESRMPSSA